MSVEGMLRRSYLKHTNADFTILKSTLPVAGEDELNSFRKPVWTRLKSVRGYFEYESQKGTKGPGGERQDYDAVAEIIYDELESIASQLDQSCRLYKGLISLDTPILEEIVNKAWRIEKFLPAKQSGNFSVVVIGLKFPEKGNQVILK
ncbi:hypothetical protein CH379_019130 [Leptospira ellisii]|uniref:Uncharacterized protein n=1 Tax=Leptospira ellisii TaxID=2023197 RepID=A0AAE4QRA1_9LEPT|nr:hypothetical protein [Leptospira ellisii]MDV6237747.1 hypothetical protein [Leptospira ellisii]